MHRVEGFSQFLAAMSQHGLEPAKEFEQDDGKLVRYQVRGDKSGTRNGWAVFYSEPVPAGAFGSWRTGEQHNWRAESFNRLNPGERSALAARMHEAQRMRREEEARVRAEAAARARRLWQTGRPATNSHPYLVAKGVPAYGIRALRQQLMIPGRDSSGMLHTLQFIGPDGSKRFLSGGRVAGCYYPIGKPGDVLLLAEGYATAATLYQATGYAVATCFNCKNLIAVAKELRAKFPRVTVLVCADNDADTTGNPGLTAAMAAAKAVGGRVALPLTKGVGA